MGVPGREVFPLCLAPCPIAAPSTDRFVPAPLIQDLPGQGKQRSQPKLHPQSRDGKFPHHTHLGVETSPLSGPCAAKQLHGSRQKTRAKGFAEPVRSSDLSSSCSPRASMLTGQQEQGDATDSDLRGTWEAPTTFVLGHQGPDSCLPASGHCQSNGRSIWQHPLSPPGLFGS